MSKKTIMSYPRWPVERWEYPGIEDGLILCMRDAETREERRKIAAEHFRIKADDPALRFTFPQSMTVAELENLRPFEG